MNEQKYNHQNINAYLLGTLPEIEAERFDELSFTDENFADILKSAEKDLIDSFVQGELGGETLEKFKSHYLASPLRREKAEFAKAFQVFAGEQISKKPEESIIEESKPKRFFAGLFSSLNIFKNQNSALQFGFAAVLLCILLGGGWIIVNRFNEPEIETAKQDTPAPTNREVPKQIEEQPSATSNAEREIAQANTENNSSLPENGNELANTKPIAEPRVTPKKPPLKLPEIRVATFMLAPSLRSGNRIQSVSVTKEITDVVMRLQLESDDYAAYRVVLINQSNNKNLWQSDKMKAKGNTENKLLNVRFPAKLLKSQIYSLQVSGIAADGDGEIISDYVFRVVR